MTSVASKELEDNSNNSKQLHLLLWTSHPLLVNSFSRLLQLEVWLLLLQQQQYQAPIFSICNIFLRCIVPLRTNQIANMQLLMLSVIMAAEQVAQACSLVMGWWGSQIKWMLESTRTLTIYTTISTCKCLTNSISSQLQVALASSKEVLQHQPAQVSNQIPWLMLVLALCKISSYRDLLNTQLLDLEGRCSSLVLDSLLDSANSQAALQIRILIPTLWTSIILEVQLLEQESSKSQQQWQVDKTHSVAFFPGSSDHEIAQNLNLLIHK